MLQADLVKECQDLRFLEWSKIRHSSGTAGSFLKARQTVPGKTLYYKLSCYDSVHGIVGHECVNELLVDRLLGILGVPHLRYCLMRALVCVEEKEMETFLCVSENFREPGESKVALDDFYDLEKESGETIEAFFERMGWTDYLYTTLVVDYLILNRDRHGANIEILRNRETGRVRLAPLFDHGISFLHQCRTQEEAQAFDPLADVPVQCFFGSRSATENLKMIPPGKKPALRRPEDRDRGLLFAGLEDVLPDAFLNKIWEMITARWRFYESL